MDDARRRRALLDCFPRMHPMQLDGHALQDVRYDLGTDPKAHRLAHVAMIDARALANGGQRLLVGEPAQPDLGSTRSDQIPFWRGFLWGQKKIRETCTKLSLPSAMSAKMPKS